MNVYTDGAIHHNCPSAIADHERRLLWQEVSDWPADILLSLGTGLSNSPATVQSPGALSPISPQSPHPHARRQGSGNGLSLMWWTANAIVENQLDCEAIWKEHCAQSTPPGQQHLLEEKRRNLRINVQFPGPRPDLDDVEKLESMQRHAENAVLDDYSICAKIHEAAHRLIASSFYFEKIPGLKLSDRATGIYRCDGESQHCSPQIQHRP